MTSQNEQLKIALFSRWITPLEALTEFGCMRLGARIFELREQGESIADKWVELPNGKRVKAYKAA